MLTILLSLLGSAGKTLAAVGKWFIANPVLLYVLLLTCAFVIVIVSKNHEIASLDKSINDPKTGYAVRLTAASKALDVAHANVTTLNNSLIAQNASILALQKQGDASQAKFDTIIAGQQTANVTLAKKIAAIDGAKPGIDKCQSAFDLIRSSVQ